jgi:hypothetical protein
LIHPQSVVRHRPRFGRGPPPGYGWGVGEPATSPSAPRFGAMFRERDSRTTEALNSAGRRCGSSAKTMQGRAI